MLIARLHTMPYSRHSWKEASTTHVFLVAFVEREEARAMGCFKSAGARQGLMASLCKTRHTRNQGQLAEACDKQVRNDTAMIGFAEGTQRVHACGCMATGRPPDTQIPWYTLTQRYSGILI